MTTSAVYTPNGRKLINPTVLCKLVIVNTCVHVCIDYQSNDFHGTNENEYKKNVLLLFWAIMQLFEEKHSLILKVQLGSLLKSNAP